MLIILLLLNICYITYVCLAGIREQQIKKKHNTNVAKKTFKHILPSLIPLAILLAMNYLFILVGGTTTVQFNAGSSSRMNAWSTWVNLWPVFILISTLNGLGCLIWFFKCLATNQKKSILLLSVFTTALSAFTFYAVLSYFPTA